MTAEAAFRATVQASSEVPGRGTVVVAAVEAGEARVGDVLHSAGWGATVATVTSVEVFAADDPEEVDEPVLQVGLLLVGVGKADTPRGSVLEVHRSP